MQCKGKPTGAFQITFEQYPSLLVDPECLLRDVAALLGRARYSHPKEGETLATKIAHRDAGRRHQDHEAVQRSVYQAAHQLDRLGPREMCRDRAARTGTAKTTGTRSDVSG